VAPASFGAQLESCLRVPYPFVIVLTWERDRAREMLASVASTVGLAELRLDGGGASPASRTSKDAVLSALDRLSGSGDPGYAVLFDLHHFSSDPDVVRRLRDVLPRLEANGRCLVAVQPTAAVPVELERDVVLLELPLPADDELLAALAEACAQARVDGPPEDVGLALVQAARGLTRAECRRLFRRAALEGRLATAEDARLVGDEKRRLIRLSDTLELSEDRPSLASVGGLDLLKAWLATRARAFGEDARAFGLPQPKGLLLLGVQGCGKSLVAKAVADFWGLPLARFDLGQLFRRSLSPEEALRQVLRLAESLAPLILWIDEIDKSFQGVGKGGGESLHRVFGAFITWLQEKQAPVFVVATANAVADLPGELLRKGRMDEIFFVDLPHPRERGEILRIHMERRGRAPAGFDLDALVERTEHFSGAELEQIVVGALYDAFAEGRDIEQSDLLRAVSETVPLYFTYEEPIKALRQWARTRARPASADSRLLDLFGD
jgi:hypothetical protein